MNLEGKNILITGGTGSFGKAYTKYLTENYILSRLVIYSRDEQKHYEMKREFQSAKFPIHFILGDVRDMDRLHFATQDIDCVIHSAAMKHVPMAEENPFEAVKTNILGTQNLVDACIENQVKKVVALSTDKAALPINTYGATKFLLERLFLSADSSVTNQTTRFSIVRYANVFGSKGSVIPLFLTLKDSGELPITDSNMTRFSISMKEGIELVQFAVENGLGGEIVVPIAPSYTVENVAMAVCEACDKKTIGPRKSEKMHEIIISEFEASMTIKKDPFYIIVPEDGRLSMDDYCKNLDASPIQNITEYSSGENTDWLSVSDIKKQIREL